MNIYEKAQQLGKCKVISIRHEWTTKKDQSPEMFVVAVVHYRSMLSNMNMEIFLPVLFSSPTVVVMLGLSFNATIMILNKVAIGLT